MAPNVAPSLKLFPPASPKKETPFSLSGKTGDQIKRAQGKNCSLVRPPFPELQWCDGEDEWEKEESEKESEDAVKEEKHMRMKMTNGIKNLRKKVLYARRASIK